MTPPLDTPFAALSAASCPPYDEMLVALEREFCAVHGAAVAEALDELARPLFGLANAPPEECLVELGRAAWAALPDQGADPPQWFLACALDHGRAAGAVRAAVAVELGRRAGIAARPARLRGCWAVHVADRGAHVAVDVGADAGDGSVRVGSGGLCAHQLAFAILTGLAAAWRSAREVAMAQRACGLRLLLPLDDDLRSLVQSEVRALGSGA